MLGVKEILLEAGLAQYYEAFLEQGFDTPGSILDMVESDFDALQVKLGHRRTIQRTISNLRGYPSSRPLASVEKCENNDGGRQVRKRKYTRHLKLVVNAPVRPISAYVIFSNEIRETLKGKLMSFIEIAKVVGEKWRNLSQSRKDTYEKQAFDTKDKYNQQLLEYQKTQNYKDFKHYMIGFMTRQKKQQGGHIMRQSKQQIPDCSAGSSTTTSTASRQGFDPPPNSIQYEMGKELPPISQLFNMPKGPIGTDGNICQGYRTHQDSTVIPTRSSQARETQTSTTRHPYVIPLKMSSIPSTSVKHAHNSVMSVNQLVMTEPDSHVQLSPLRLDPLDALLKADEIMKGGMSIYEPGPILGSDRNMR